MPRAAQRACAQPGCGGFAIAGRSRCREHGASQQPRRHDPTHAVYKSPRWKALRRRVLSEEPVCRHCGSRPSVVVDHLTELTDGGDPFDRANLAGSCNECNVSKGQRAAQRRRKASA